MILFHAKNEKEKMQSNWKIVFWMAGLITVTCCVIAVFVFFPADDDISVEHEREYPVLEPNEKLFDFSAGWYRYPGRKLVFEFDGPFPKMPDKMLVYRIIRPKNITEAYVRELAERYFDMPTDSKLTRSSPRPAGSALYCIKTQSHLFEFDPDTEVVAVFATIEAGIARMPGAPVERDELQ